MAFCARQKPLKEIMRFLMSFFIGMLGVGFSQTEFNLKDLEKSPPGLLGIIICGVILAIKNHFRKR